MQNCLNGKTIIFLGSSVTYGSASGGVSFADFVCERNNCTMVKEAVSGTTLVDNGPDSYVSRMKTIEASAADLFICQLSTNDATQKKPLGAISEGFDKEYDTSTIAGAIEYVISYAKDKWKCPVAFYTNTPYGSKEYLDMLVLLKEIAKKWGIYIINLWDNEEFNKKALGHEYMADPIHPTKEGYLEWWTPFFEEEILKILK